MIKICGITPEMRSHNIYFTICVGFFNSYITTLHFVPIFAAGFVVFLWLEMLTSLVYISVFIFPLLLRKLFDSLGTSKGVDTDNS